MQEERARALIALDSVRDYFFGLYAAIVGRNVQGRPTVDSIVGDLMVTADALGDVATGCLDEVAAIELDIEALTEEANDLSDEAARAARIRERLAALFE